MLSCRGAFAHNISDESVQILQKLLLRDIFCGIVIIDKITVVFERTEEQRVRIPAVYHRINKDTAGIRPLIGSCIFGTIIGIHAKAYQPEQFIHGHCT